MLIADDEVQLLNVAEADDGWVTMDVALPAAVAAEGLTARQVAVTFNGQPIDARFTAITDDFDVVLAVDTSGSMASGAMAEAKGAAASFVDRLPPSTRIGVVGFGDTATVHLTPSTDRAAAATAIDNLAAEGETALWEGLVSAADLAAKAPDRAFVVLLSDGGNSVETGADEAAATTALIAADTQLYTVGLNSGDADHDALRRATTAVGGRFAETTDAGALGNLYDEVADRLSNRYRLSFPSGGRPGSATVTVSAGADAIAYASTELTGVTATAAGTAAGPTADGSLEPVLGMVSTPSPGLLQQPIALTAGLVAMFAALLTLGLLMALPSRQTTLASATRGERVVGLSNRMSHAVDRALSRRDREGALDQVLDAAGINLRPGEFTLIALVAMVISGLVGSLMGGAVIAVMFAVLAGAVINLYLTGRAGRRRNRFAEQLTDTIGIVAGALRAGRGLPQAVELVAEEAPSPTAEQFRRIVFEARVGRDVTESMMGVARRMQSQDFEWVARAVQINRELGGDLAEVLDNVADTIRDRRRVARMVKTLSAEGRMSGWVMLALPFVFFLFLSWRNPEQARLLTSHNLGRLMLAAGMASMVAGYFWIRKLVDIKF